MSATEPELRLRGIAASPGIAVGPAVVVNAPHQGVPRRRLPSGEVELEVERLRAAIERSRSELEEIRSDLDRDAPADYRLILEAHLMMHRDELLIDAATESIVRERINAEWAVARAIGTISHRLAQSSVDYFRDRAVDVEHVGNRILAQLAGRSTGLPDARDDSVLVIEDLHPADAAQLIRSPVAALVTGLGSATSHTAILARTLAIPAVVGVTRVTERVGSGDCLIVDAFRGEVVLEPSERERAEAQERARRYRSFTRQLRERAGARTTTLDGVHVELMINAELQGEAALAVDSEAEGIGLYRTEFLFIDRQKPPSEDEQYAVYAEVVRVTQPNPVTLRTIDLGGDSLSGPVGRGSVPNPALGLRAIRLAFARPELFRTQLRAILRAAAVGPLRVMFPMIAGVSELRQAKAALADARAELLASGVAHGEPAIGVMIELPSAVLMADRLAEECDFFAVGTNDLVQYTLAADRANPDVAYLARSLDPAVLRLLDATVRTARAHSRELSMCGDMAADAFVLPVVVGLGFRSVSLPLSALPLAREVLRRVDSQKAAELARAALDCATADEVQALVSEAFGEALGDLWSEAGIEL